MVTTRVLLGLTMLPIACLGAASPVPDIAGHALTQAGPLVRRLDVELAEPGSVTVIYDDGERRLEVESADPLTIHTLTLARLRAGTRYTYEVRTATDLATGEFVTDPLPSTLAAVDFSVTGTPTQPLILLEFFRLAGSETYAGVAIVDDHGSVVWHYPAQSAITGSTRHPDGDFVFLDTDRGLLEVTVAGEVVSNLPQDADRTLHHEVIAAPDGVFYALRLDRRPVNDTLVAGEAIWEWNPATGAEVRLWSSFDALDPVADRGSTYSSNDWLHANSLSIGPRGNIIMSLHHLDQIVSIAPGFNALEWRLGGVNATIPVPAPDAFSGQHSAAGIQDDRVLLFDNGFQRSTPYSRAIEFDLSGSAARNVWEFRPSPDNWSRAVGSARRLANGNTVMTFGMSAGLGGSTGPVEVYEVAPDGSVAWHMTVGGNVQIVYRATPLSSIAGERIKP